MHFIELNDKYIKSQWDGTVLFSSYKSNARGVCILFNNNLEYQIESFKKDNDGNLITVNIKVENNKYTIINISEPNEDQPNFMKK